MQPGQSPGDVLRASLDGVQREIKSFRPSWVIAQGDTTTAAASGLAAFYAKVPFAHVEAGLRTYDLQSPWPEEFNRRLLALCAQLHLAPTAEARDALLKEGTPEVTVHVTGNTGIDALLLARDRLRANPAEQWKNRWADLGSHAVLCTLHRRENFGHPLREILRAIRKLADTTPLQFIFPVHRNPAVREAVAEVFPGLKWDQPGKIRLVDPLEYAEFIYLMDRSLFLLTDSGGVQEEAPCLGKPVLVCRESTERPEAVAAGAAICVGTEAIAIEAACNRLLNDPAHFASMAKERFLFGDGKASERIVALLGL